MGSGFKRTIKKKEDFWLKRKRADGILIRRNRTRCLSREYRDDKGRIHDLAQGLLIQLAFAFEPQSCMHCHGKSTSCDETQLANLGMNNDNGEQNSFSERSTDMGTLHLRVMCVYARSLEALYFCSSMYRGTKSQKITYLCLHFFTRRFSGLPPPQDPPQACPEKRRVKKWRHKYMSKFTFPQRPHVITIGYLHVARLFASFFATQPSVHQLSERLSLLILTTTTTTATTMKITTKRHL